MSEQQNKNAEALLTGVGLCYNQFNKHEFYEDTILMKLEHAELKHIERIVAISKAAFDSDMNVGAS